jgi:Flp pilus assembly protein CpaB
VRLRRVLLALAAGITVAGLAFQVLTLRASDAESVDVVIAARDLGARATLTSSDVRLTVMPRHAIPAGSLTSIDAAIRRVLRDPVYQGEILNQSHIAALGVDFSASLLIPSGKDYVVNIPTNIFFSAPPRLQLHDRIDIIGYPKGKALDQGSVIVRDLEIVDLSSRATDNVSETAYLTVGVNAEDVIRVLAARDGYLLAIVLRPFNVPSSVQP